MHVHVDANAFLGDAGQDEVSSGASSVDNPPHRGTLHPDVIAQAQHCTRRDGGIQHRHPVIALKASPACALRCQRATSGAGNHRAAGRLPPSRQQPTPSDPYASRFAAARSSCWRWPRAGIRAHEVMHCRVAGFAEMKP